MVEDLTLTLEQLKGKARYYTAAYLADTLKTIENKNIEPLTKQKLVSAALALTLYVQDELQNLSNSSDESISE